MLNIDMKKYSVYKGMGKSCELRTLKKKHVTWPDIGNVPVEDTAFHFRVMREKDAGAVAELWRVSYPEVYGSVHEWILDPSEHLKRCALIENWENDARGKKHLMIVGEDMTLNRIIFATLMTKWDRNLHIEMSFVAIHPDFRKSDISNKIFAQMGMLEDWLIASGAEYVTVFCETWHNITQYLWFKRMGWKVAGIFPGNFTRWVGDNKEYRACTVHLYKILNGGEPYTSTPDEWELLPEIRELWHCMEKINALSTDDALHKS